VEATCTKCKKTKPIGEFYLHGSRCKVCRKAISRKYGAEHKEGVSISNKKRYEKNKARVKKNTALWLSENKEKHKTYEAAWRKANPEKVKATERRRYEKVKSDPSYKLNDRISAGVRSSLVNGKNGRKWEAILGYSLDDLKHHLERNFQPGMSWGNIGDWHVDHIIPRSAFNFETPDDIDFKRAWCLMNIRPLWAHDNLVKWAKLDKPFQPSLAIGM